MNRACLRRRDGNAPYRWAVALLLAPALALLVACTGPSAERPTQVVARVNGTEISLLQVEQAMRAQRAATTAEPDRAQVVATLVDRELAVQQALSRKLDRQPEVMLRLEEARREILARAFAEQVAAASPRPTPEAVRRFYAGHPELFSQRRVYRLRELVLPVPSAHLAEAKDRLARRQPLPEIADWLSRERARYGQQEALRPSEQLPLEALARLQRAAEGETVIFESSRAVYVYQVLGIQAAPMDLATATPLIEEHLARQGAERATAAEFKTLRTVARIEIADRPAAGAGAVTAAAN